jgi:restriction endonuclease
MLYKLDSVDAYEQKLVKQIEVAGIDVKDGHNKAYIKLLSVNNKKSPISAKVEIDARRAGDKPVCTRLSTLCGPRSPQSWGI